MKIQKIALDKLRAAEYNPRKNLKPGDAEFEKLRRSIEQFGYVEPAIWNKRTGNLVGGHQRIKVLQHLGHTEADCVVVDIDDAQEKALNIALNKISGDWDEGLLTALLKDLEQSGFDLSLTGFDVSETAALFGTGAIENVVEDDFDENKAIAAAERQPTAKLGDIWQLGNHKLLCGDSTNPDSVAQLFGAERADIMLTDPPYNVDYADVIDRRQRAGYTQQDHAPIINDKMKDADFKAFLVAAFKTACGIMRDGAVFYVFYSNKEAVNFTTALAESGLKWSQTLTWVKNHFTIGRQDYQWITEPILFGWKQAEGVNHYFINDRTKTTVFEQGKLDFKKMSKADMTSLLERIFAEEKATAIYCEKRIRNAEHPTMKPVKLCAELLNNSSRAGDLVYEPFCGSGSTLIAAEQLNRKCYAIELDPHYCDVVVKRWEELTGQKAVRL